MNLEDRNYWNDSRVIAGLKSPVYEVLESNKSNTKIRLSDSTLEQLIDDGILPEEHDGILTGTTKFEVCGTCRGTGKTVNPSIDCCGLTREDFDDDPDFHESYMRGDYDITCPECKGERVVPRILFHGDLAKAIEAREIEEANYARELAYERAMGY